MSKPEKGEDVPSESGHSLKRQVVEEFLNQLQKSESIPGSTVNVFRALIAAGLMDRNEIVAQVQKVVEEQHDPS